MRLKETKEIQLLEAMYDPGFGVLFCWFWEVDLSFFSYKDYIETTSQI